MDEGYFYYIIASAVLLICTVCILCIRCCRVSTSESTPTLSDIESPPTIGNNIEQIATAPPVDQNVFQTVPYFVQHPYQEINNTNGSNYAFSLATNAHPTIMPGMSSAAVPVYTLPTMSASYNEPHPYTMYLENTLSSSTATTSTPVVFYQTPDYMYK